ncbi:ATP-dependent zinc metalloprotease FtsH [Martelella mediterranea]|uniref:ATP-dependent zinc metalloprotease FtsH n=1 Tax=Martelella mediterranea DSM 17316 TaxID=1122214 RepID=A0A1U9Z267_9HYPH|nr:ATP-dependent zinc metalloprotease FtsH [Martelella mediterranea]AQZ51789.1 ATP-dependent zinc metalloprotease FtsH 4 [Martelella mediterranea DSM 17316]
MERKNTFNLGYFLVAFLIVIGFQLWFTSRDVARISYSDMINYIEKGQVQSVAIAENTIEGKFKTAVDGKEYFVTYRVPQELAVDFDKYKVDVTGVPDHSLLTQILSWVLPIVIFFAIWAWFFRKFAEKQGMGLGGMMNIGKSKAKIYVERDTGVTFDDVAGADEAKVELKEVVSFLTEREKYGRLGAHIPKGLLLVGPPGTGKTLIAKAVAGEAGVTFFSISGSEFVEMFVGVGAARVRDLFKQAREMAPCIIFIDELDALGRARNSFGMGGNDEKEQTLNQLLVELDGFDPAAGIVILAATNRPEVLDPALTRAGRFDRQVVMDRPDRGGREAILAVHMKKIRLAEDVDAGQVAALTPGFSGADLANLVNEAAIFATRRGGEKVTMEDFTQAVERTVAGSERRGRLLNPDERERVAFHEMGHALAAAALPKTDPVHKISIIPRSIGALGYTMQRPTEDRFLITAGELRDRMVVLLAGRAAEDIVYGEISTGASDDLARVTDIARQYVMSFGMDPDIGQAALEQKRAQYMPEAPGMGGAKDYSDVTAREIDLAIRKLIDEAYERAKQVLNQRRKDLDDGARMLLEKETITPADFPPLVQQPLAQARVLS